MFTFPLTPLDVQVIVLLLLTRHVSLPLGLVIVMDAGGVSLSAIVTVALLGEPTV
jgi:hypothetical protein